MRGEIPLLLTPPAAAAALSASMQALGRRYVGAYNRRHGCSGTLWDGRFRCAVVEGGAPLEPNPAWSSASNRLGVRRLPWLTDPPEVWPLGNTPFDREASKRTLLPQRVTAEP